MTLRPSIPRLLEHPVIVLQAEEHLRHAVLCLRQLRAEPERAAHWLIEAEKHTTAAWKRLDEEPQR